MKDDFTAIRTLIAHEAIEHKLNNRDHQDSTSLSSALTESIFTSCA